MFKARGASVAATVAIALLMGLGAAPAANGQTAPTTDRVMLSKGDSNNGGKGQEGSAQSDAQMISVWTEYGVPAETQNLLLQKVHSGQAIDSMTGAKPVAVETQTSAMKLSTVARYADGSISVSTIQSDSATSPTQSVGDCAVNATTYAQYCRVNGWFGPIQLTFYSSYTKKDGQASVYNWTGKTFICGPFTTCSAPKYSLTRQYQSGTLPAQINLYTDWSTGISNGRATLSLFVKDRTAWTN